MKLPLPLLVVLALPQFCPAQEDRPQQPDVLQFLPLPGVELTEEQKVQIEKVQDKYRSQLQKNQARFRGVYTPEQRQARREAFEKARKEGKQGRELRTIAEAAVQLTDEQKKEIQDAEKDRNQLLSDMRGEVLKLLTQEQRQQVQRRANRNRGGGNGLPPTHANVKYGPHPRQVMDVWLAESSQPTPVLVSIHGGGFRSGNKSVQGGLLRQCLDAKISVVAITYRLSDVAIAPAQFHDAARAVQYLRHRAQEWNFDPERFAGTGGSAGAGLSLWLGFHEDLADADNNDPVRRESSRLQCMAVYNGQTSYDPRVIRELFPGTDTYKESALAQLFDVDLNKLDELPTEKYELFEEVSAMPHLTKDDGPALLMYASNIDTPIRNQGIGIHHPKFGAALKEKMDKLGIECTVKTGVNRANDQFTELTMEFLKRHRLKTSP